MSRYATLIGIFYALLFVSIPVHSAPTHSRSKKSPQVSESVTAAANCIEGYVISGSVKSSRKDVKIVEETKIGCNTIGQCIAYQVRAMHPKNKPFDIDVTVVCSEDGLDTEENRAKELMRQFKEGQK